MNLRFQEQLSFRVKDGPMGVHKMDESSPHFVKVPNPLK